MHFVRTLVPASMLALSLVSSFAPARAAAQPPAAAATAGPEGRVDERVQMLVTRLRLTPAQATSVRQILVETHAQMRALRDGQRGRPDDASRDARRQIAWQAEDRIWAVLTCDQRDTFRIVMREQREQRHARFEHHRGHRGHGPRHAP